jgi:hypothetical protein
MLGLGEKLALPFLALVWAGAILSMCWIIFRPPVEPRRSDVTETGSQKRAQKRRRGPLTAKEKTALSRRRPLAR